MTTQSASGFVARVPPLVGVVALPLFGAIGALGLHALGWSWAASGGGAAGVALVTTFFLYLFLNLGNRSRVQVEIFLWKRLGLALIASGLGVAVLHFGLAWPLLASVGVGATGGVVALGLGFWVLESI